MERGLRRLRVENFGILGSIDVELRRLNVLVGPNGSGKSTLLDVIQFLGDAARSNLAEAIEVERGGYERVRTRAMGGHANIRIEVHLQVTSHAHEGALDEYVLEVPPPLPLVPNLRGAAYHQVESFKFKRTAKQGRRITLSGGRLSISDGPKRKQLTISERAFGLADLPNLGKFAPGADEIGKIQELFTQFRVFDIDASKAREPSVARGPLRLSDDASNLAAFLAGLRGAHPDRFERVVHDARAVVPGLLGIRLRAVGGATDAVVVEIEDEHLPGATPLSDASFGTVRALAMLAMLHDPDPPILTCVEEIDHGFHPHVFDRLVELLRAASKQTQFLIATHSPALVNRLEPAELIVCERDEETGLARIPELDADRVREASVESGYGLGELWFSGTLGGVPR